MLLNYLNNLILTTNGKKGRSWKAENELTTIFILPCYLRVFFLLTKLA